MRFLLGSRGSVGLRLSGRGRRGEGSERAPRGACTCTLFQDQVEAADGGGPGAAGRGGQLLGPAEDVPVALLLPPEPAGQHGQHHRRRGRRRRVQQHVPDSARAPPAAAAAPGAPRAHPRPGARWPAGSQPFVQPHAGHPAPPVKKGNRGGAAAPPSPPPRLGRLRFPSPHGPGPPAQPPAPGKLSERERKTLSDGRGPGGAGPPSPSPLPQGRAGELPRQRDWRER